MVSRESIRGGEPGDIAWFPPDANLMSDDDWGVGFAKSLAVFLNGEVIPTADQYGRRIVDDSFYLIFNAHWEPVEVTLPPTKWRCDGRPKSIRRKRNGQSKEKPSRNSSPEAA